MTRHFAEKDSGNRKHRPKAQQREPRHARTAVNMTAV